MIEIGFAVPEASDDEIRHLEQMGADSLWSTGHLWMAGPCPEALTAMARIGFLTSSVKIGTSVLVLPLYPPVIVAKMVAELDRMLNGRVMLGVGVGGEFKPEFDSTGVPVSERGARTDEGIGILKSLWQGGPVDLISKYDQVYFDNFELEPLPSRRGGPPIIIGGRAPQAMRRAAALGDGWQPMNYTPRRYAASVAVIREEAERLGRSLDGFIWGTGARVTVTDNPSRVREEALSYMSSRAHAMDPAIHEKISMVGDVDTIAEGMIERVDAGARHFVVSILPPYLLETAEVLLGDIRPLLQQHLNQSS